MAHANVALNFNAFLEKTKLKDDGSNYTDWVCNLRIILIAARKAYVLDAPLGEIPVFPTEQDVMNAWQSRADDYSLVQCGMLYSIEPGLQKRFERHGAYEMFEELKMVSKLMPGSRDMKSPTSSSAVRWRKIVLLVSTYSKCLGCTTACLSWELTSRMMRSLIESFSRSHLARRALR